MAVVLQPTSLFAQLYLMLLRITHISGIDITHLENRLTNIKLTF